MVFDGLVSRKLPIVKIFTKYLNNELLEEWNKRCMNIPYTVLDVIDRPAPGRLFTFIAHRSATTVC